MSSQTETEPVQLDRDRSYRRFAVLGHPSISDDPFAAIVRHDEIPEPCWREIGKRDLTANNTWFYQCWRDDIPVIYVSNARKYVRLACDCISNNGNGDKKATGKASNALGNGMFGSFQRLAIHDSGKAMYRGWPFGGTIEAFVPSTAFAIADTFFATLFHPTRAASPKSVTQVDGQTFGEVADGV
ncbi:hypothetical protein [Pseudohoeflea coraliihabitans]|uniref:Uncharacterized protein n=1 Tax=Pseudohoeflea coraliihabitans TaxID=2860393 RepID=A0ABS6WMF2_9HYPH|nr:hypothetical protein [Pseudohoeflea sp. DP4N28-3]MBW3097147.1 hypothetical protein [Pseudohoeflea sp. DP4N28-3]